MHYIITLIQIGIYTESDFSQLPDGAMRRQAVSSSHSKFSIEGIPSKDINFIRLVLSDLKPGDSYDDFIKLLHNTAYQRTYLINYILRAKDGIACFFDENGIFTSKPIEELKSQSHYKNTSCSWQRPVIWPNRTARDIKYVIQQLIVGDKLDKLNEFITDPEFPEKLAKQREVATFITKYSRLKKNIETSYVRKGIKLIIKSIYIEAYFTPPGNAEEKEKIKAFIKNYYSELLENVYRKIESLEINSASLEIPIRKLRFVCSVNYDYGIITFKFHLRSYFKEDRRLKVIKYYKSSSEQPGDTHNGSGGDESGEQSVNAHNESDRGAPDER